MDKKTIVTELNYFKEYNDLELEKKPLDELKKIFNEHCEKYSENVQIIDIWDNYTDLEFLAATPDGYIPVGNFYKKKARNIHQIKTTNDRSVKVSNDHLFETNIGWKKTDELIKKDLVLTEDGFFEIKENKVISVEEVYDWEILHENHRYWVDGISSHNTGKSFVCLNIAREAQLMGYEVIYCDTEGAIDKEGAIKFGIDPKRMRYQPIQTVNEFKHFVMTVVDIVTNSNLKIMLVLDSLGMLGTDKELNDARGGHNAGDMGLKAKELRALFRAITFELTKAKIPLICTNHIYTAGGYVPVKEASGGLGGVFSTSIIPFLSKAQLKEGDTKTGIIVTSKLKKSRFTVPIDIKFHISFSNGMNKYVGLENYVSWEACGIQRGKIESKKDFEKLKTKPVKFHEYSLKKEIVDKSTGEIKIQEEELVFIPSDSGRWCIKHFGKSVVASQLFTGEVFTLDVLQQLDENIIKKTFLLPDLSNGFDQEMIDQLFEDNE